jgi:hypothetical protein
LDGDAANGVALQKEMLESEVGGPALRIRPSPTDREENNAVELCTESGNSERGDDAHHATTARNDRQLSGYIQVEGGAASVSLSNNSYRTDTARVIRGIQPSTLKDSRRNTQQTASPRFSFSRKRCGVALPELPSMGPDVSDEQISCRKKVSLSPPSQNRHAAQKRRPQGSPLEFPLPGLRSRSVSCEISSRSDEGQHDVREGVVWEYRHLLDYRIVNGKPLVLVPWTPTWELPDEFPEDEVDRVRREYYAHTPGRRRGRPRSKQHV